MVKKIPSVYRTGEYSLLLKNLFTQFLGLDIEMSSGGETILPRKTSISRLEPINIPTIVSTTQLLISKSAIQTLYRSYVGRSIWFHLTRFGTTLAITPNATTAPHCVVDVNEIRSILRPIDSFVKISQTRKVEIYYGRLRYHGRRVSLMDLEGLQFSAFPDAGFSSLRGNRSQESGIIISGRPYGLDGSTH